MLPFILGLSLTSSVIKDTLKLAEDIIKETYSTKEAAEILGISEYTVRKKIRDGEIVASGKRGRNGYTISYQEVEKYSAKTKKSGIIISDKSQVSNILPNTSEMNDPQKLAEFINGMEDEVTLKELQLERLQLDNDDSIEYKKQELDAKIEIQELKNQIKGLKFKLQSLQ
jgi:excisionase family DNA binding protein